jgi:hypothetical protein
MPEPLTQRMSFVIYFKYLRPIRETVHTATPHSDMLARIAGQWGISVQQRPAETPSGIGSITMEHEVAVETGTIRVELTGADTATAIRHAKAKLLDFGVKAIVLELPLAQPATADLCRAAETDGYFFSGMGPAFAADGDALLLQYLAEEIDTTQIQIANPFARELLDYVNRHREQVRRQSDS